MLDDLEATEPMPAPRRLPPAVLAVDIGGTKFAAGLITPRGELLDRAVCLVDQNVGPEAHFNALAAIVEQQLDAADRHEVRVACVGIGSAGPITRHCETVSPVNIPAWREFPLRSRIAEVTGTRVYGELDGKALALAEGWQGAAKGHDNYCVLTVSTGIGGGIVLDGELLDGASANAGHVGHIIVEPNGRRCGCGARGLPRGGGVGVGDRGDHRSIADRADVRDHATHGPARRPRGGVAVHAARHRARGRRRRRRPRLRRDVLQRGPRGAQHARPPPVVPPCPHHADRASATAAR